jgi:hypothetical protein
MGDIKSKVDGQKPNSFREQQQQHTARDKKKWPGALSLFLFFVFFLLATHAHTDSTRGVGYISHTLYTGSSRAGEMYSGRPLGAFCVRHTGEHWVLYYSTPPFSLSLLSGFSVLFLFFFRLLLLPLVRS